MEELQPIRNDDDLIDLGKYWKVLRPNLWKVALFSLLAGALTFAWMLQQPDIYQAAAVIAPSVDEKTSSPTLGAFASFGINVGGPSKVEDLETLFKSNDLTVRIFKKYNLLQILHRDKFDLSTGVIKLSWADHLFGIRKNPKVLGDWDAIRSAKSHLIVFANKKANTLSICFESPSAEDSANIVKYYLDEGKNRLQEEALDRAGKNHKFIQEQIGKTVDALTRERLYGLYSQEVEREMMARNREQFGFRIIDSPRIPDRVFKPQRCQIAILVTILCFLLTCILSLIHGKYRKNEDE